MRTRKLALLCLWTLLGASAPATAEDQEFTTERFRPLADPRAFATVETAEVPEHLEWHLGGFGNYERDPLLRYSTTDGSKRLGLVGHRLAAEGGGGIGLFNILQVGLTTPATVAQFRTDGSLAPTSDTLAQLTPLGPGDVRLMSKARLLRQDRHFISLAISADVTVPTSLGLAYRGERFPTFSPFLLLSRTWWGLQVMGNLGARFRGERLVGRQALSDELVYRAGVGYDFGFLFPRARLMPFGELSGSTGLVNPWGLGAPRGGGRGNTPLLQNGLEFTGGLRWEIVDGVQLLGGMSVGAEPGGGTPAFRVFSGLRFAHAQKDSDGDGIPDRADLCPHQAEDKDGFYDSDGCPEPDNDQDGIPDATDRCPDLAEDRDGFEDEDGCPELDNDGDGVSDPRDACPNEPGPDETQGCPEPDRDGDGIMDRVDQCPDEPEDGDGFQDEDGCPDPDNDGDGLADGVDKCPFEPEDLDGFEDADGCPDPDNDGDGVPDEVDECPDKAAPPDRAALGEGCPDEDADHDGIPDSVDMCPSDAEDVDGFEDGDGCPDRDNDHDGVPDTDDKCPNEPETINGYKDEDGCPDSGPKALVKVTRERLEILDKVYFDTGKASIQKRSNNLLNQVALTILSHPEIKEIVVEGHTDSQGSRPFNVALSQKRSDSVRAYLISRGVKADSLRAVGYGPDKPVADNKTAQGRERNRRVEFVLKAE